MASNVSYDPYATTFASESFSTYSDGVTQGVAMDDPSVRNLLAGGYVALTETLPMWGGIAISEYISSSSRGNPIARATNIASLTGFSVYNQQHHLITFPSSPAPTAGAGMSMAFYRLGSKARIPVKASPSIVDSEGNLVTSEFSWDFDGQHLMPYIASGITGVSADAVYSSGVVTVTTSEDHGLAVGDYATLAGFVPTGYNGNVLVASVPSTTTFTFALATDPGTQTTAGTVTTSSGALPLPIKVIKVVTDNARVVVYDEDANTARWNLASDNESVAVIIEI